MRQVPFYDLLSVRVNALTNSDLYAILKEAIETGRLCVIGHHNLHSAYLCYYDDKLRAFYRQAQYIYIDGMSLIWLGKLSGYPVRLEHRPTCIEYMFSVLAEAERQGWRVFYLGSKPGVAERGADIFRGKFPNLQLCTAHGYFRADPESSENRKVLDRINNFQTDILMVGMGMPRQEYWILDNLGHIEANVVISVGACMDYFSGEKPTAPRWMGPLLLEWVYRLFSEPRRLWKRYLLEPWFILGWILRAWIKRTTGRK